MREVKELVIQHWELLKFVDLLNTVLRVLLFSVSVKLLLAHSTDYKWHAILSFLSTPNRSKYIRTYS